mgnify:FL=1
MIFDRWGLQKPRGASDFQDSAMAAGMWVLFGMEPDVDLSFYTRGRGKYHRHPNEYKYTMSRDQTICLFAGLWAQKRFNLVDPGYNTEGDLVSPGVRGHFKRCARLDSNWFQDAWLMADVYAHAWFNPMGEPNQLIAMMMVADPKFMRMWCRLNKTWRDSILFYWCAGDGAWRGEPELAEKMISVIQERIK